MDQIIEQLSEIKLVGITARTATRYEMNPDTAKIGPTNQKFFASGLQTQIPNRKNPGRIFAVYTNYESDEHGEYTYFIGEEVSSFENTPQDLTTLTIPAQTYVKFTSNPGQMPKVVIEMWQNIWKMDEPTLGGPRSYIADFEIYDKRSADSQNTVLDIYIGIEK